MRSAVQFNAAIIAGVAVTLSGCTEPEMVEDLHGNTATCFEATAEAFYRQDEGLEFGTPAYQSCRKYVSDYARRVVVKGSVSPLFPLV